MRTSIYDQLSERRKQEERLERERLEQDAVMALPSPQEWFLTNELKFIRPQAFKDKTFHVLALTDQGPSPNSIVVGRSQIEPDEDLESIAAQLLENLEKTLPHMQWLDPMSPVEVAGAAAKRLEFRWREQGQPIHQIQVVLLHKDEYGRPLLIQVTCTSNDPKGMKATDRDAFEALVNSLELRNFPQNKSDEEVAYI